MRNLFGKKNINRRDFIRTLAGTAALAGITGPFDYLKAQTGNGEKGIQITAIYRNGRSPQGWWGKQSSWGGVIRIETNKGITGYGEVRDLDHEPVKWLTTIGPHLIGMNPTQIENIYNTMLQYWIPPDGIEDQEIAGTGAISAIEMACWDIVGKVYNVPVYKLLGERLYDTIPMYADTEGNSHADVVDRVEKGFKHYKCDMYLSNIAVTRDETLPWRPITERHYSTSSTKNKYGYNEITITQTGLDKMHEFMETYRETLESFGEPYASAPIGSDHYQGYGSGTNYQLSVESAIALANTLHAHNPNGYVEDIIDWWMDDCSGAPSRQVADACEMRLQTGEDMFGFDQFKPWADSHALDNFHPEPNTFGGFNQTLIAAKYAATKDITTYYHNSSGPIAMAAYAHLAAVTPNFGALEFHNMDFEWHDDLVDGIIKPMIQDGVTFVPEGPGLGIIPNETQFAAHGGSWTKMA